MAKEKAVWQIHKLLVIAYRKCLLLEFITNTTRFSLFRMKYIINEDCSFKLLTNVIMSFSEPVNEVIHLFFNLLLMNQMSHGVIRKLLQLYAFIYLLLYSIK